MVFRNLFAGKGWRQRYTDKLLDKVGEGDSGTNTEYSINIHTLPRVKQTAGEKLL